MREDDDEEVSLKKKTYAIPPTPAYRQDHVMTRVILCLLNLQLFASFFYLYLFFPF